MTVLWGGGFIHTSIFTALQYLRWGDLDLASSILLKLYLSSCSLRARIPRTRLLLSSCDLTYSSISQNLSSSLVISSFYSWRTWACFSRASFSARPSTLCDLKPALVCFPASRSFLCKNNWSSLSLRSASRSRSLLARSRFLPPWKSLSLRSSYRSAICLSPSRLSADESPMSLELRSFALATSFWTSSRRICLFLRSNERASISF